MTNCEVCGEPMPEGETMFKYHGYSGPCPTPGNASVFENETFQNIIRTTVRSRITDMKSNPFVTGSDVSEAYEKGWKDALAATTRDQA